MSHFRWNDHTKVDMMRHYGFDWNHSNELYCHKLRNFKNQKIIHAEDIEDQIFAHVFWA
jgi:hypothetical protein